MSWNHPFGFTTGPVLSAADQITKRRQTFSDLKAEDLLGSDVLEVGYPLRGYMPFSQHIDLWDTFSRQARWLTGNGASDDHSGNPWRSLSNGFLTGLWAASTSAHDLTAALAGGRAYVFHPGRTPGLHLDTLVDGAVPMGAASVSGATSRTVAIGLAALPSDCTVDLVRGAGRPHRDRSGDEHPAELAGLGVRLDGHRHGQHRRRNLGVVLRARPGPPRGHDRGDRQPDVAAAAATARRHPGRPDGLSRVVQPRRTQGAPVAGPLGGSARRPCSRSGGWPPGASIAATRPRPTSGGSTS